MKEHKKSQVQGVLTATALELEEASTTHDHEFPFVKFDDIVAATNNFSKSFMVGQGGFGKVYKVTSSDIILRIFRVHEQDSLPQISTRKSIKYYTSSRSIKI